MAWKTVLIGAIALGAGVPSAFGDIVSASRDSSINVGLITVAPMPAPATSTVVDSAADLMLAGGAGYSDGFGRDFVAFYDSAQDVEFGPSIVGAHLTQSASSILNSAGNPASSVFSVDVINHFESSFTVTQDTVLRLTLNYTGTVTTGSAPDRVDFRINTQFGGLFVMPVEVPGGQYSDETLTRDIEFFAGTTYFLVAEARAFSGGGDGLVSSDLGFSIAPVPAPGALALFAAGGVVVTRRKRN